MSANSHLFKKKDSRWKRIGNIQRKFSKSVADCSYTLLKLETINEKTNFLEKQMLF